MSYLGGPNIFSLTVFHIFGLMVFSLFGHLDSTFGTSSPTTAIPVNLRHKTTTQFWYHSFQTHDQERLINLDKWALNLYILTHLRNIQLIGLNLLDWSLIKLRLEIRMSKKYAQNVSRMYQPQWYHRLFTNRKFNFVAQCRLWCALMHYQSLKAAPSFDYGEIKIAIHCCKFIGNFSALK